MWHVWPVIDVGVGMSWVDTFTVTTDSSLRILIRDAQIRHRVSVLSELICFPVLSTDIFCVVMMWVTTQIMCMNCLKACHWDKWCFTKMQYTCRKEVHTQL